LEVGDVVDGLDVKTTGPRCIGVSVWALQTKCLWKLAMLYEEGLTFLLGTGAFCELVEDVEVPLIADLAHHSILHIS
jgi:hypothetical protein